MLAGGYNHKFYQDYKRKWSGTSKEKYLKQIKKLAVLLRLNDLHSKPINIYQPNADRDGWLLKFNSNTYKGYNWLYDPYIHLINSLDFVTELEFFAGVIHDPEILRVLEENTSIKKVDIATKQSDGKINLSYLKSLKNLESLRISGKRNLEELRISGTVYDLPSIAELSDLENLKKLSLHLPCNVSYRDQSNHQKCPRVPDEIGKLKNLRHLRISAKCDIFSDEIGSLSGLEILELEKRYLNRFPEFVLELTNLRKLYIRKLKGPTIPDISRLKKLNELDLGYNNLTSIPDISQLSELKKLDLGGNKLTSIPDINKLPKSITRLDLHKNNIDKIPDKISELENLEQLILYNNNIDNFPPELSELNKLEILDLDYNNIDSLPEEIPGSFSNLKKFSLSWNPITELPKWVEQLPNLEKLSFSPTEYL